MHREEIQVCTDRVLSERQQWEATEAAINEREGNALDSGRLGDSLMNLSEFTGADADKRLSLVSFSGKRFRNGRTLKVFFIGSWPEWASDRVMALMKRWSIQANIHFERTADRAASDVRIDKDPSEGSWSYLGTDILGIPKDEKTMNLGWILDTENDFEASRRVVVHEAGHTLSFGHEQAHPEGDIDWNREAVYAYYGGPPNNWSRAEVDAQVFRKYQGAPVTNFSEYDRHSIMHYAIPAAFVTDPNDVVGWNTNRSPLDKRYAALWYPYPKVEEAITAALDELARAAEARLNSNKGD
jgi:serralysin